MARFCERADADGRPEFRGRASPAADNIYAQKKVENGKTLLPQMYGDPKGYHATGSPSWYHYTGNLFQDRLAEIYFWSMDQEGSGARAR